MLYKIRQVNDFKRKATTILSAIECWLFNICCAIAKTWRECYLEILWVTVEMGGGLCLSFMAYSSVTQLKFLLSRERQNKHLKTEHQCVSYCTCSFYPVYDTLKKWSL